MIKKFSSKRARKKNKDPNFPQVSRSQMLTEKKTHFIHFLSAILLSYNPFKYLSILKNVIAFKFVCSKVNLSYHSFCKRTKL